MQHNVSHFVVHAVQVGKNANGTQWTYVGIAPASPVSDISRELRDQAIALGRAVAQPGRNAEELSDRVQKIEGCAMTLFALQAIDQKQLDDLLDELHSLL